MRIRTIKPEFFTHEGIFDAEAETGLPLRLAFIGLWCAADREGRFRWEPRRLKVQILPYDDTDFSRVLDALATRGFVVRYASETGDFGAIPSFLRHQVINNRERESELPDPLNCKESDACMTREPRVSHASKAEGNMERNGREHGKEQEAVADATRGRGKSLLEPAACEVLLGSKDPALLEAWAEWQRYRQHRAQVTVNGKKLPWTQQAAELSARQIMSASRTYGARLVVDRITSAISANWQGLNLDKLDKPRWESDEDLHRPDPDSEYGF